MTRYGPVTSADGRRGVAAAAMLFLSVWVWPPALESAPAQALLDQLLAAYTAGDHDAVAKSFPRSTDFQRFRLLDTERLDRWLGAWTRPKAALLMEIIDQSSTIGPAYTTRLVSTGQRYMLTRVVGSSAADDDFERHWHVLALGALQRRFLTADIERYLDALQKARPAPASATVLDPRLEFARGVAQEQRCRTLHATARLDRVLVELEGAAATPPAERQAAIDCVQGTLSIFEATAARPDLKDEARTRAGFALFQLGRNAEAQQALDGVVAGADKTLAYWRALFRGRVADALGDDLEAERSYRAALAEFPDAHSASIGLALALFRLHRDDDADEAARAVHQRSLKAIDPWESYFAADGRLIPAWIAEMRGKLK